GRSELGGGERMREPPPPLAVVCRPRNFVPAKRTMKIQPMTTPRAPTTRKTPESVLMKDVGVVPRCCGGCLPSSIDSYLDFDGVLGCVRAVCCVVGADCGPKLICATRPSAPAAAKVDRAARRMPSALQAAKLAAPSMALARLTA